MDVLLDGRQMTTTDEAMNHLIQQFKLEGQYRNYEDIRITLRGLSDIDRNITLTHPTVMEDSLGSEETIEIIRILNQLANIHDNQTLEIINN